MRTLPTLVAAGLLAAASPALASTIVFEETFDGENAPDNTGVLNYTNFANFEVVEGDVDLIGNGRADFLPGNGLYLDLDGTGDSGGTLALDTELDGLSGPIEVSFDLAGSQRGSASRANAVEVTLNGTLETFTLANDEAFQTFTLLTDASDGLDLVFAQQGDDGVGLLLDNVVISMLGGDDADDDNGFGGGSPGFGGTPGNGGGVVGGGSNPGVSVPTPGAAAAGLILLGGVASRRRSNRG